MRSHLDPLSTRTYHRSPHATAAVGSPVPALVCHPRRAQRTGRDTAAAATPFFPRLLHPPYHAARATTTDVWDDITILRRPQAAQCPPARPPPQLNAIGVPATTTTTATIVVITTTSPGATQTSGGPLLPSAVPHSSTDAWSPTSRGVST